MLRNSMTIFGYTDFSVVKKHRKKDISRLKISMFSMAPTRKHIKNTIFETKNDSTQIVTIYITAVELKYNN